MPVFPLRLFTVTKKAGNNYNNAYFNDAYRTGFGEQAIEIKCGDEAFSSGNVPDLGNHYSVALDDLHATTNKSHSSVNSGDVAEPTYQTVPQQWI